MTDLDTKPGPDDDDDENPLPAAPGKTVSEAWLGVFVIFGLVSLVGLLFTMTDAAFFRGRYIVSTKVNNAGGIRKGDPVQMRGVNIGRILRFTIDKDLVKISLEIEGEYIIPKDSVVDLHASGMLGGMVADIKPGQSNVRAVGGDELTGRTEEQMMASAGRISAQLEQVLAKVDTLLAPAMIENVHGTTREMNALMKDLRATTLEQRQQLATLTASLNRSVGTFETTSANLQTASTNMQQASLNAKDLTGRPELGDSVTRLSDFTKKLDDASAQMQQAATSLQSVTARMNNGQGTLGKLSVDETLYNNLTTAAANMNSLSEDIRKNPRKYINLKVF